MRIEVEHRGDWPRPRWYARALREDGTDIGRAWGNSAEEAAEKASHDALNRTVVIGDDEARGYLMAMAAAVVAGFDADLAGYDAHLAGIESEDAKRMFPRGTRTRGIIEPVILEMAFREEEARERVDPDWYWYPGRD